MPGRAGGQGGAGRAGAALEMAPPPWEEPVLEGQLPVPTLWVDPPACVPAQESQGALQLRRPPLGTLQLRRPPLGTLQLRRPPPEAHQPPYLGSVPKTPNSPHVRWSCPLLLSCLLLKRSLRATSLYPNPSAAPLNSTANFLTSLPC